MALFWKLAMRIAGAAIASGPVLKASRRLYGRLRQEAADMPDEKLKERMIQLEEGLDSVLSTLEKMRRTVRNLVIAVFAVIALAAVALILAIIRLV